MQMATAQPPLPGNHLPTLTASVMPLPLPQTQPPLTQLPLALAPSTAPPSQPPLPPGPPPPTLPPSSQERLPQFIDVQRPPAKPALPALPSFREGVRAPLPAPVLAAPVAVPPVGPPSMAPPSMAAALPPVGAPSMAPPLPTVDAPAIAPVGGSEYADELACFAMKCHLLSKTSAGNDAAERGGAPAADDCAEWAALRCSPSTGKVEALCDSPVEPGVSKRDVSFSTQMVRRAVSFIFDDGHSSPVSQRTSTPAIAA